MKYLVRQIKKNKIIILAYLFLIISIIFVITSSTHAYFSEKKTANIETITTDVSEGLSVTSNADFIAIDLVPVSEEEAVKSVTLQNDRCKNTNGDSICSLYEFTVTNEDNAYRTISYYLIPRINTFKNLKYKVFNSSIDNVSSNTEIVIDTKSLERNSLSEIELTGLLKKIYPSNKSDNVTKFNSLTYTIMFWIDKQDKDQTIDDAGKEFKATLKIEMNTTGFSETKE